MANEGKKPALLDFASRWGSPRSVLATALIVILGSVLWIYYFEFGAPEANVTLHRSVGQALADETARVIGHQGSIVLVTMDPHNSPEIKIQVNAFEKALKASGGITIKDKVVLDPGENPKFRPGSGLSAKRFLKIARKHAGVDAIVSFVGAPEVSEPELAQLTSVPKLIAETHSPEKLVNLVEKKVLVSAIVPRFEFPAPGPRKPQTGRQWFDRYFQILTPETALPSAEALP